MADIAILTVRLKGLEAKNVLGDGRKWFSWSQTARIATYLCIYIELLEKGMPLLSCPSTVTLGRIISKESANPEASWGCTQLDVFSMRWCIRGLCRGRSLVVSSVQLYPF